MPNKKAESGPQPVVSRRTLHFSYASGLLSMGQAELLTMLVPLWALMQGAQPAEIGLLIGAKSALTFFLAIHGGALMDRLGTRRVMLFFAGATAVLATAYPFLPWLPAMIMLQMLIGFAGNMNWIGAQTSSRRLQAAIRGLSAASVSLRASAMSLRPS
ncbi:MAG: MFS transporter [Beijerinckiaceae bacterium]|nr:MFS transporter [Beijerinckiaceae bacterium]